MAATVGILTSAASLRLESSDREPQKDFFHQKTTVMQCQMRSKRRIAGDSTNIESPTTQESRPHRLVLTGACQTNIVGGGEWLGKAEHCDQTRLQHW